MNRDFEELLSALSVERCEFLIVGAHAVAFHTEPRYTKDLDLWVRPVRANAVRVRRALAKFGAPVKNLSIRDLCTPGIIFQIGVEPNRVDVLTKLEGLDFEEAWRASVPGRFGAVDVRFLSAASLVVNKRAVGRPQDLLDIARLAPVLGESGRARASPSKRRRRR